MIDEFDIVFTSGEASRSTSQFSPSTPPIIANTNAFMEQKPIVTNTGGFWDTIHCLFWAILNMVVWEQHLLVCFDIESTWGC